MRTPGIENHRSPSYDLCAAASAKTAELTCNNVHSLAEYLAKCFFHGQGGPSTADDSPAFEFGKKQLRGACEAEATCANDHVLTNLIVGSVELPHSGEATASSQSVCLVAHGRMAGCSCLC